jgi:hypothetical protein
MNRRISPRWLVFSLLLTLILGNVPLAATQAKKTTPRAYDKRAKSIQPVKLPGTISGADNPAAIPDNVAWELFLRTVGENNARPLVERAGGFDNESETDRNSVDRVMDDARSLNDTLTNHDKRARELKDAKNKRFGFRPESDPQLKAELNGLRTFNDGQVAKTVNRYLPGVMSKEAWQRMQGFVNTEVKSNIQVIPARELKEAKGRQFGADKTKALAQTTRQQAHAQGGGNIYLYSAGWNDEANVYGSGTLIESNNSGGSYLVTVTVTSPTGRANTTQSDWSYAATDNTTGLSIGVEDGNYAIQAQFEQQDGYYDEYGNFVGTGSYSIGNQTANVLVAPQVSIESAVAVPPITLPAVPPNLPTTQITALISFSDGAPANLTANIELNPITAGVDYTVGVPTGNVISHSVNNRTVLVGPGSGLKSVTWPITISSGAGAVGNRVRIESVSTGGIGINNVPVAFTVPPPPTPTATPTPTPTPTQTPTPRPTPLPTPPPGCALQRTAWLDTAAKDGAPLNIRSGCDCVDFDPLDALACHNRGGTWDWASCFCGASPIVLDVDGDGYNLTNVQNGVRFDITGRGYNIPTAWTAADSDDAWLVLDRNQNHRIDSATELFGDNSEQPEGQNPRQGFASLGMFDQALRGGNGDGKITRRDAVFRKLRLWQDRNHNGVSEPEELSRLPALDVVAIFLDYRESRKIDRHGNRFKYRAKIRDRNDARVGRWAWDVFLVITPQ